MTAAIFGLIGVVIGAAITGGLNYTLQVRAEHLEVRAAARLMLAELSNTGQAIRYAIELKNREIIEGVTHEDEWARHHLLLARHLSDDEWYAVAVAYGEGTVAATLLENYMADGWYDEAARILCIVDAGREILRARAESPRALIPSALIPSRRS